MKNKRLIFTFSAVVILLLFLGNLFYGAVVIPFSAVVDILSGKEVEHTAWTNIIIQSRLPQAVTALISGAALAVSGLMLQTLFKNPLAGPSILGISDGANLGVAVVMLYLGGSIGGNAFSLVGSFAVVTAALTGAYFVLALIVFLSTKVKSNILILIIGMMIGYLASSGISILNYISSVESVHSFVMWGMGNFSGVSVNQLPFYCIIIIIGLLMAISLVKPLNLLLLGERYAANLGVHITRTKILILICTGLLTSTVTAFCGPISFIGLAVPHIARLVQGKSDHKILLPITLIYGGMVALICNLIIAVPIGNNILPLNAVTPLIGAPIIIYVILNRKNNKFFD